MSSRRGSKFTVEITRFNDKKWKIINSIQGGCFAMRSFSFDNGRSEIHGLKDHKNDKFRLRRCHWTGDLASNDTSTRRICQTRTVTLLKQIMQPVKWNSEKSKDVLQQYHHWLTRISKYEAISGDKVNDTIKITLALQHVRAIIRPSKIRPLKQSRSTPSRRAKENFKNRKDNKKGSKGSSSGSPTSKGRSKGKGETWSKGEGELTAWSWNQNQIWIKVIKRLKGKTRKRYFNFLAHPLHSNGHIVRHVSDMWELRISNSTMLVKSIWKSASSARIFPEFPQDQPAQTMQPDQLRGFRIFVRKCISSCSELSFQQLSVIFICLSSPWQVSGFSGHRLNSNHFTKPCNSDVEIKEINATFPYDIGPNFPQHLQEPWAALIDTDRSCHVNCASVICTSRSIMEHSIHHVNVNDDDVKIIAQKSRTSLTRMPWTSRSSL